MSQYKVGDRVRILPYVPNQDTTLDSVYDEHPEIFGQTALITRIIPEYEEDTYPLRLSLLDSGVVEWFADSEVEPEEVAWFLEEDTDA